MGLRGIPEGRLHFDGCRVPREHVLVGPPDGFKKLMEAYNSQRLGAATVALGLAQGAYELALAYAGTRRQFGRAIGDFQGIRWKLADMAIKLDAARLLIHRAAANAGTGFPDALEAAKAKTFAAEMAQEVTGQALQIHGAAGYGRGAAARAHGARRPHVRNRRGHRRDDAQPHRRPAAADPRRLPALVCPRSKGSPAKSA